MNKKEFLERDSRERDRWGLLDFHSFPQPGQMCGNLLCTPVSHLEENPCAREDIVWAGVCRYVPRFPLKPLHFYEREESDITRRLFDKKRRECTAVSVQNKVGKMLVQYVETRQIYPFNIIIHLT